MHTKKFEALLMLAGRLYSFLFTLIGNNLKIKIKLKNKKINKNKKKIHAYHAFIVSRKIKECVKI